MPFFVFESDGVERAINADEALAVLSALYDHAVDANAAPAFWPSFPR